MYLVGHGVVEVLEGHEGGRGHAALLHEHAVLHHQLIVHGHLLLLLLLPLAYVVHAPLVLGLQKGEQLNGEKCFTARKGCPTAKFQPDCPPSFQQVDSVLYWLSEAWCSVCRVCLEKTLLSCVCASSFGVHNCGHVNP